MMRCGETETLHDRLIGQNKFVRSIGEHSESASNQFGQGKPGIKILVERNPPFNHLKMPLIKSADHRERIFYLPME
jgi:hypothetical protein